MSDIRGALVECKRLAECGMPGDIPTLVDSVLSTPTLMPEDLRERVIATIAGYIFGLMSSPYKNPREYVPNDGVREAKEILAMIEPMILSLLRPEPGLREVIKQITTWHKDAISGIDNPDNGAWNKGRAIAYEAVLRTLTALASAPRDESKEGGR